MTNIINEINGKPTNNVVKVNAPKGEDDDEEAKDDSNVPAVDITMDEGRRILQDLVALAAKPGGLVGRP